MGLGWWYLVSETKYTVEEFDAAQFARILRENKYGEDKHSATWVYDSIQIAIHKFGLEEKYAEDPLGTLADVIDQVCEMEDAGEVPESVLENITTWFCSECGSPIYNDAKPAYCIYCGARVVIPSE